MYECVSYLIKQGHSPQEISEAGNKTFDRLFIKVTGNVNFGQFIEAIIEGKPSTAPPFHTRFFVKDEELSSINEDTYGVSNQWGTKFRLTIEALTSCYSDLNVSIDAAR
ncbi:MAG: hypothetical protein RPT25_08805 [Cycloclasticus sp.]|jgi:hypothetical protein